MVPAIPSRLPRDRAGGSSQRCGKHAAPPPPLTPPPPVLGKNCFDLTRATTGAKRPKDNLYLECYNPRGVAGGGGGGISVLQCRTRGTADRRVQKAPRGSRMSDGIPPWAGQAPSRQLRARASARETWPQPTHPSAPPYSVGPGGRNGEVGARTPNSYFRGGVKP